MVPKAPNENHGEDFSTLAQDRFLPSRAPVATYTVVCVEGEDDGLRFAIDGSQPSRVLIGQSPACEIRLTDRRVSRRHAAFDWVNGRLRIRDLGSKNGTLVDHIAIGEVYLNGGEHLRIGATVLRIESGHAPVPTFGGPRVSFGRTLGASREMRRLYPLCERLANVHVPAIIEGETGTGKEVLAESLHEEGPRASGPFVVFDCTAVHPTLVESDLFGHERGAFTGAVSTRKGVFEQAHGGTLLIDEIGDLELSLQPKLLRALESGEIRRVGGSKWIRVDVRVLSATRRDLDREIQAGRFRDDLFHRLAGARIELPPLRDRRGDVPFLARHFCKQFEAPENALPSDILARWDEQIWSGNVRELRNAVARYIALGEDAVQPAETSRTESTASAFNAGDVAMEALFKRLLDDSVPYVQARRKVLAEFERRYTERVLAKHGGNVARAAAESGIARRYFQIIKARAQK